MSGAPPPRSDRVEYPPPPRVLAPTLATAGFLAGLVALWGFTSLALDRDVIDYPDAGPLVGPAMAVTACVVVFLAALRAKVTPPLLLGVVAGLVAYVAAGFVGAVAYSLRLESFAVWWPALVHFGIGPFLLGAGILAGIVVGVTAWLVRPRYPRESGAETRS